uniref:Uncharacterized protein n=1 Tax=Anguilla anguilla TaxID=7936 RepID=A0A0E9R988_ANGAN
MIPSLGISEIQQFPAANGNILVIVRRDL